MLEEEQDLDRFRILWVTCLTLLRAVGHVLDKVDSQGDKVLKKLQRSRFAEWKNGGAEHSIFRDFIEAERNSVLKTYEAGYFAGDELTLAVFLEDVRLFPVESDLYRPIEDGPFAGEDARNLISQALEWWDEQLANLERDLQQS